MLLLLLPFLLLFPFPRVNSIASLFREAILRLLLGPRTPPLFSTSSMSLHPPFAAAGEPEENENEQKDEDDAVVNIDAGRLRWYWYCSFGVPSVSSKEEADRFHVLL